MSQYSPFSFTNYPLTTELLADIDIEANSITSSHAVTTATLETITPQIPTDTNPKKQIVVAITGASGIIYAIRLLEVFRQLASVHSHLIISPAAELTLKLETSYSLTQVKQLADSVHRYDDIGDTLSSGSVPTDGMVIVPCSIKTLSAVANCYDSDLIVRCADVHLKERRKLLICLRETPLHLGHLRLMTSVVEYGAQMMPLMPAFYHLPTSIDDIVNQGVARICDQLAIAYPPEIFTQWQGTIVGLKQQKSH